MLLFTTLLGSNLIFVSADAFSEQENVFEEKRILFISSYSPSFSTFYQQIEGIKDTLDDYPIIIDMEFMDSKRFYTEETLTTFINL